MKSKSERTREAYLTAGAYLKLFKYVYHLGWEYLQPVCPKSVWNLWNDIDDRKLIRIKDELERRMMEEHPEMEKQEGRNYTHVFYSELDNCMQSALDRRTNAIAAEIMQREIIDKYFGK